MVTAAAKSAEARPEAIRGCKTAAKLHSLLLPLLNAAQLKPPQTKTMLACMARILHNPESCKFEDKPQHRTDAFLHAGSCLWLPPLHRS
jgi:hypothetical protein